MAKFNFDYMEAARKMADKGDHAAALHYYFLQRNKSRDKRINVYIGDSYAQMGLLQEAVRYYMRAYAADQHNEEALNGLIYCYKDLDEEASYYYLHCALLGDEDVIEEFHIADEDDCDYDYPPIELHDKKDKSEIMDFAVGLFENGNVEEAKELFMSIDKDSYQYCDALLARASIEMEASNAQNALALADEALGINPRHLGAHMMKIVAYDGLDMHKEAEEWLEKLDALDTFDEEETAKVALCYCNFDRYALAQKYLLRKLEYTPYDKLMLMCLAAVKARLGDEQAAFGIANKVCSVYPDDVEVKEITSEILSGKPIKMPEEIFRLKREWVSEIKELFLRDYKAVVEPDNIKKVKWLLQGEEDIYLQSALCAFITGIPQFDNLMDDILIDPFAPVIIKKQILLRRVCDDNVKRIKFVVANLFRSLPVKHPNVADNLKYAYYYVFIALAVSDMHFSRRLSSVFRKVSAKYESCSSNSKESLQIGVLAAIIYLLTADVQIKRVCEYFDCAEEDIRAAFELLDLQGEFNVRF